MTPQEGATHPPNNEGSNGVHAVITQEESAAAAEGEPATTNDDSSDRGRAAVSHDVMAPLPYNGEGRTTLDVTLALNEMACAALTAISQGESVTSNSDIFRRDHIGIPQHAPLPFHDEETIREHDTAPRDTVLYSSEEECAEEYALAPEEGAAMSNDKTDDAPLPSNNEGSHGEHAVVSQDLSLPSIPENSGDEHVAVHPGATVTSINESSCGDDAAVPPGAAKSEEKEGAADNEGKSPVAISEDREIKQDTAESDDIEEKSNKGEEGTEDDVNQDVPLPSNVAGSGEEHVADLQHVSVPQGEPATSTDENFHRGYSDSEGRGGATDNKATPAVAGTKEREPKQGTADMEDGEEKDSNDTEGTVAPEEAPTVSNEVASASNDESFGRDDTVVSQAVSFPSNNESHTSVPQDAPLPSSPPPAVLSNAPVSTNDDNSDRDHTTNRYKVNGVIRRPCVCANSDECRAMVAFWCEAVDEEHNFRDCKRAGYIRLPVYQPNARTPTQLYKNFLRLSFLGHVRPAGSTPSARWLATTRRQGKNTAEYIALHHFPREFLKEGGKGLNIECLDDDMAKTYKLTKNDKINTVDHPLRNQYYAPPCYKWSDLLSEYLCAVNIAGVVVNQPLNESDAVRESARNSKPKILCLGMSKACVESHMDVEGYYWDVLKHKSPTVQQAKELVHRNILTQMDARDLARCRAMEARHKVDAYTVSQEHGAQYDRSRHMHANFNRANFCHALQQNFDNATFRQIALDYFWIPSGTWMTHHWSKSFFHTTLPNFVKKGLLEYPPPCEYGATLSPNDRKLGYGVVYLPFCLHCVKQLIASMDEIKQYYKISFLYKSELAEHALWSGTSTIDAKDMQHVFGKNIAQEEVYCTFAPRDVFEAMEDAHITKAEVVKVLRGIEDFSDVRMIRLTPLSKHNPRFKRIKRYDDEVGGFVGLLNPKEVERGFDSLLPASKVTETESSEEEEESTSEEEIEIEEPSPPVIQKKTVRRTRQLKPKEAIKETEAPVKETKKRKRMFEVLPDLTTYCTMGLEGNESVMKRYELPRKKWFRAPCDIDSYHFFPEPEFDEPEAVARLPVKRSPSLVSKITLSFTSGYEAEQIRAGHNVNHQEYSQEIQPATVDDSEELEWTDAASPGYLMMLACTSEVPGVKRLDGDRNSAIESYTTILGQAKVSPLPAQQDVYRNM